MALIKNEFTNFQFLLNVAKNQDFPKELRNSFPWILWRIWKNRNSFFFDGKIFNADESVGKIRENSEGWFNAQKIELRDNETIRESQGFRISRKWSPPQTYWLKCNVGATWSKRIKVCGAGWVFRDSEGIFLVHSGRSFSNVKKLMDAKFMSIIWVMESMLK
ncbi:hypothetical protein EUTSA_v10029194mg, partial [Eutrema salsugineum]